MKEFIMLHKKFKYYLIILVILWSGTFVNVAFSNYPATQASLKSSLNSSQETSILYTNSYQGELDLEEKNKLTNELLTRYHATAVDEIKTDSLFTVYAYNKDIPEAVTIGEDAINVNVVFYYNEITDRTSVILASPIFNEDF